MTFTVPRKQSLPGICFSLISNNLQYNNNYIVQNAFIYKYTYHTQIKYWPHSLVKKWKFIKGTVTALGPTTRRKLGLDLG